MHLFSCILFLWSLTLTSGVPTASKPKSVSRPLVAGITKRSVLPPWEIAKLPKCDASHKPTKAAQKADSPTLPKGQVFEKRAKVAASSNKTLVARAGVRKNGFAKRMGYGKGWRWLCFASLEIRDEDLTEEKGVVVYRADPEFSRFPCVCGEYTQGKSAYSRVSNSDTKKKMPWLVYGIFLAQKEYYGEDRKDNDINFHEYSPDARMCIWDEYAQRDDSTCACNLMPPYERAASLAVAMGCEFDDLFGEYIKPGGTSPFPEAMLEEASPSAKPGMSSA